ncbi:MAG: hypothetical protein ACXU85_23550 [Xanthobacteraceae bacterium]
MAKIATGDLRCEAEIRIAAHSDLLDHLVGARDQRCRHSKLKRIGGLSIDRTAPGSEIRRAS